VKGTEKKKKGEKTRLFAPKSKFPSTSGKKKGPVDDRVEGEGRRPALRGKFEKGERERWEFSFFTPKKKERGEKGVATWNRVLQVKKHTSKEKKGKGRTDRTIFTGDGEKKKRRTFCVPESKEGRKKA